MSFALKKYSFTKLFERTSQKDFNVIWKGLFINLNLDFITVPNYSDTTFLTLDVRLFIKVNFNLAIDILLMV